MKFSFRHFSTRLTLVQFWIPANAGNVRDERKFGETLTLEDFRTLWDDLAGRKQLFELSDQPRLLSLVDGDAKAPEEGASLFPSPETIDSNGQVHTRGELQRLDAENAFDLTWISADKTALLNRRYKISNDFTTGFFMGDHHEDVLKGIEMTLQFVANIGAQIMPLSALLRHCSPADSVLAHDFAHAFPNLNSRIKADNQDQTKLLVDLEKELSNDTQLEQRDFEIFGVKVRSDQIAILGLPSLLFFLLNLAAIASYVANQVETLGVKEASNWSFLLKGRLFSFLTFTVVVGLPWTAAIGTWIRVHDQKVWTRPLSIAVIVASSVAAYSMFQLRRRVGFDDGAAHETNAEDEPSI